MLFFPSLNLLLSLYQSLIDLTSTYLGIKSRILKRTSTVC
jgi:hypothetical protein